MPRLTRASAPARGQRRPMVEVLESRLVPGSVLNPYTLSMTCLDDSGDGAAEAGVIGASGEQASPTPADSAPADSSATSDSPTSLSDSPAASPAGDTSSPAPANAPDSGSPGDTLDTGALFPAVPAPATSAPSPSAAAPLAPGPVALPAASLATGDAVGRAGPSASAPALNSFAAAPAGIGLPSPAHAAAATHTATPTTSQPSTLPLTNFIIYPRTGGQGNGPGLGAFGPGFGTYSPTQVRTAYGINLLPASNEGQGVTIGIVDEFADPTIVTDVAAFSSEFGLPQLDGVGGDGTLTISEPQGNPGNSAPGGTSIETALDVEWAHSMAPKANIDLVFVPATGTLDNEFAQILAGVQFAASQPGVVAVSTSYGIFTGTVNGPGGPYNGLTVAQEQSLDSTYLATGAATNVALTFSSGDYSLPLFPAVSPNVIAVGGTTLETLSAKGRYGYELAWGGYSQDGAGGGGVSQAFATPVFQSSNGVNFGARSIPDVSMVADPITGVAVYSANDAPVNGGDPWFGVGGTSLSSPLFAGVIALAQQDRIAFSLSILNSVEINSLLYATYNSPLYLTYFHDVALGNNNDIDESRFGGINITGFNATTGYDLASGIGSPIGNTLVPFLVGLV